MGFDLKRKLYESLPLKLQRSLCLIPFTWWAGRAYRETYRRGPWFDRASREQLRRYQEERLGEMLRFASDQVPAYQGLRRIVERHRPFDALRGFPLLEKSDLQSNIHHYLPRDFERIRHYEVSTGGTSGSPLRLFVDDVSQSVENAFQHRLWDRVGYRVTKRRATFRGVRFSHRPPDTYWKYNPIYNELQFSPFHMNESTMVRYLEEMDRFRPQYLYGYPSAIDLLAEFVLRRFPERTLPPITAALLISESVEPEQRERIERAFGCRVFSFYGHSERVVMGGECEYSTAYHHFPDYGVLEIIPAGGEPSDAEGQRGEIVGTGFLNRSLPLIRYRTGDYATRLAYSCPCGRCWDRFADVESHWGRNMLVGRQGQRISIKRYTGPAMRKYQTLLSCVKRMQYFQETWGHCVIRIMVAEGFTDGQRLALETAYNSEVGQEIQFRVQIVEDIPLTARGKVKPLESRVDPPLPTPVPGH